MLLPGQGYAARSDEDLEQEHANGDSDSVQISPANQPENGFPTNNHPPDTVINYGDEQQHENISYPGAAASSRSLPATGEADIEQNALADTNANGPNPRSNAAAGPQGAGVGVDRTRTIALSLRRELQPRHIFCISIGAVIGMGFYIKTGIVATIGGPGNVICAYSFLGALAFAVLQDQARLLHVWPIRGALVAFVEDFVDEELGQVVGFMYWLTYCFSFAALTATVGMLLDSFDLSKTASILLSVISIIVPLVVNLTDIRYLKECEFWFGLLKLAIAVTFNTAMMVVNPKVGSDSSSGSTSDSESTERQKLQTREVVFTRTGRAWWIGDFCIAVFISAFAFVGIEAVAATATEVDFSRYRDAGGAGPTPEPDPEAVREALAQTPHLDQSPFSGPAWLVPLTTTLLYLWGGWIVTENVASSNPSLAGIGLTTTANASASANADDKLNSTLTSATEAENRATMGSIFIIAASFSKPLETGLRILLILNVVLTSSTALYIASRTLYALGMRHSGVLDGTNAAPRPGGKQRLPRLQEFPHLLIWKNKFQVPFMAVLMSVWPFIVAFLRYRWPGAIEKASPTARSKSQR
ncbi:hypothetical protein A1O3_05598 [Capronia epimyces CBS 606.96]|uniref:Amino acid permease/ SLC12A domain-containing protein n=1 Tax=Capronia epimyces CBS 606.96 TaxID=1182542 RepID=W9XXH8_9EURO|nr:uncharacterized protein A1O3_05598 [Capronia epimyces CBS 606.96]EXJ84923.1 hypothetical protein A1O3_05598 [Capronia epimyces CBS 606.96]